MIFARATAAALLLLCLATAAPLHGVRDEDTGLPILESGAAVVDLGTRRLTIRYSTTVLGPLVEVQPLITALGGELEIGPLGESHELTLNDLVFAFGPGSDAVTSGAEIVDLSQKAIAGETGAQVPIDLLDHIYGNQLGYEFNWNSAARLLLIRNQPARELGLQFNLVHVQGVTTVVFQFSTRPRYRVRTAGRTVVIDLIGDRLIDGAARKAPTDELVRGVTVTPTNIRLQLVAGAVAEDYTLDRPFRLVFDVFRGGRQGATEPRSLPRPRQRRTPDIRTIVLDPGHGGSDTGAVSAEGVEEKRLTLQLARTAQRLLEERLPVRVVLTRDRDIDMPLEARAALANQNKGDLFVSLHLNSSAGSSARGAETYFLSLDTTTDQAAHAAAARSVRGAGGDPLFDLELRLWDLAQSRHLEASRTLARLIQEELDETLEVRSRGVRQAPLRVLMGVAMPAVLVEFGYLSNAEERTQLQDPEVRYRLADALVKALTRFRAQVRGVPEESEEAVR